MAKILIYGGGGFIARHVVIKLVEAGHVIKIISRNKAKIDSLKVCGYVGQIVPITASVLNEETLKKHSLGMDVVVNLIGARYENHHKEFDVIHNIGARNIAKYAMQANVKHLIHFSSLSLASCTNKYTKSKSMGEESVLKEFPKALIIRPSVVFGAEDVFFNNLVRIFSSTFVFPLIYSGSSLLQPIYVGDVASFVCGAIEQKITGKIYEIAGPRIFSVKELILLIVRIMNRKIVLINMPFFLVRLAVLILGNFVVSNFLKPFIGNNEPILTDSQLGLLMYDNITDNNSITLIVKKPKCIEEVMPQYLKPYKQH